jgi:hypothetical protein
MKLPVIKAFATTFAFVFGHFLDVLKIVWLPLAAILGTTYWFELRTFPIMSQMSSVGGRPDPQEVLRSIGPLLQGEGLLFLALLIFMPMLYAGILRFVIRGQKPSLPFYLRFGGDELRVLLTFILLLLLIIGVCIGGGVVIGVAAGVLGTVAKPAAGIVVAVLALAFVIFMIWLLLRTSLALPAAISTNQIGIGPSWSAAKGNVWSLLLYWILWAVFLLVIDGIYISLVMPDYFHGMGDLFRAIQLHAGDPAAVQQAIREWEGPMMQSVVAHLPLRIGASFVAGIVLYPLIISSAGVAYRMLTEGSSSEAGA